MMRDAGGEEWAALPRTPTEARAAGLRLYYTGKPCPRGHVVPRFARNMHCPSCDTEKAREWRLFRVATDPKLEWARASCNAARVRARKYGVPFTIVVADILKLAVDQCPALGFDLVYSAPTGGGGAWNSATLDRIIPPLGYVPGNLAVLSRRGNSIKNDATPAELAAVAAWAARIAL